MKLRVALPLALLLPFVPVPIPAQIGVDPVPPSWRTQQPGSSPMPNVHNNQPVEDPADAMRRTQFAKLGQKRQDQAKADAAKLLALATELKEQVDTASGNTSPAKVATTSDAIVKLAKSVKSNSQPL